MAFSGTVTGRTKTVEYGIWSGMIQRCTNSKCGPAWKHYGGRGIRVCEEWLGGQAGFEAFLEHVGPRPSSGHSLDRIDVNGHYEPGNVRWATWKEQAANRRPSLPKGGRPRAPKPGPGHMPLMNALRPRPPQPWRMKQELWEHIRAFAWVDRDIPAQGAEDLIFAPEAFR